MASGVLRFAQNSTPGLMNNYEFLLIPLISADYAHP
jgi:hypothetical protein